MPAKTSVLAHPSYYPGKRSNNNRLSNVNLNRLQSPCRPRYITFKRDQQTLYFLYGKDIHSQLSVNILVRNGHAKQLGLCGYGQANKERAQSSLCTRTAVPPMLLMTTMTALA